MIKNIDDQELDNNITLSLLNSHLPSRYLATNHHHHNKPKGPGGTIMIGYRGTFSFGRESLSDVKFRKISRILVCGRVQLCREVFGDALNESRDPDHGVSERYTSRFFLKHWQL